MQPNWHTSGREPFIKKLMFTTSNAELKSNLALWQTGPVLGLSPKHLDWQFQQSLKMNFPKGLLTIILWSPLVKDSSCNVILVTNSCLVMCSIFFVNNFFAKIYSSAYLWRGTGICLAYYSNSRVDSLRTVGEVFIVM